MKEGITFGRKSEFFQHQNISYISWNSYFNSELKFLLIIFIHFVLALFIHTE